MNTISDALLEEARSGGPGAMRAGARLMTLLENEPDLHADFLSRTGFCTSRGLILGVTGAPGSGKSTLVDALLGAFREKHPEAKIGVVAVDPSSPFSGGAILADRIRMMRHSEDGGIFMRSMACRGTLGGLSLGVAGVLAVMNWMGFDLILVETVGVGQSEIDIVRSADEVAVVLAPGNGDSMQLLKAGLMEIGGVIAVNKADLEGAQSLYENVQATMQLDVEPSGRDVVLVSSTERLGVQSLADLLEDRGKVNRIKRSATGRASTVRELVLRLAASRLDRALDRDESLQHALSRLEEAVPGDWNEVVLELLRSAAEPDGRLPSKLASHVG